jgi:hypothetical protein
MPQSLALVLVHIIFSTKNRIAFQEEFRAILEKHAIAFDERYVWD